MNRDVDFSKSNVSVNWKYVKGNFRDMGILTEYVDVFERRERGAIKDLIQNDIYEEFEEQVGAGRYERTGRRRDFRKGEYERCWITTFGSARIRIPRTRPVGDDYKYLLVDGIWVSVKEGTKTKKRPIIVVLGIRMDNTKEVLAFKLVRGESEDSGK